jgi:hypothetical protein
MDFDLFFLFVGDGAFFVATRVDVNTNGPALPHSRILSREVTPMKGS